MRYFDRKKEKIFFYKYWIVNLVTSRTFFKYLTSLSCAPFNSDSNGIYMYGGRSAIQGVKFSILCMEPVFLGQSEHGWAAVSAPVPDGLGFWVRTYCVEFHYRKSSNWETGRVLSLRCKKITKLPLICIIWRIEQNQLISGYLAFIWDQIMRKNQKVKFSI